MVVRVRELIINPFFIWGARAIPRFILQPKNETIKEFLELVPVDAVM